MYCLQEQICKIIFSKAHVICNLLVQKQTDKNKEAVLVFIKYHSLCSKF